MTDEPVIRPWREADADDQVQHTDRRPDMHLHALLAGDAPRCEPKSLA